MHVELLKSRFWATPSVALASPSILVVAMRRLVGETQRDEGRGWSLAGRHV